LPLAAVVVGAAAVVVGVAAAVGGGAAVSVLTLQQQTEVSEQTLQQCA